MRFGTKDWEDYKANLAAINAALAQKDQELAKKHYAAIRRYQEGEVEYAARSGGLIRIVWKPWISAVPYKKASFEGFMDWLSAGRPKLAAKLHVKHL